VVGIGGDTGLYRRMLGWGCGCEMAVFSFVFNSRKGDEEFRSRKISCMMIPGNFKGFPTEMPEAELYALRNFLRWINASPHDPFR